MDEHRARAAGQPREATWARRFVFFFAGLVFTCATWEAGRWLPAPSVGGPERTGLLMKAVLAAPWILALVLLMAGRHERHRVPWVAYSLGMLLPWVLVVGWLLGPSLAEYAQRTEFDGAAWRSSSGIRGSGGRPIRQRMVDDLMDSGLLRDKTAEEVLALLGPDDRGHTSQDSPPPQRLTYLLGPERGFISIDSEWLEVRFNQEGRVDKAWTRTD
ncbi:MAG: hypothetical protein H6674_10195 [Dehalococcoidia bacterium]|nr:hypothetical protein [Dehalococcoidia bacterium]